jgi:hypothetical protein
MEDLARRFLRVFKGSELTHGVLTPDGGIGTAKTHDYPAVVKDVVAHFEGRAGLGICPATPEGLVYFAAIDVDNHDGPTDHMAVCAEVARLKLTAIVTQTRRKGAHIYFFFPQGENGGKVLAWLHSLTSYFMPFGDPIEVFPKQRILAGKNKGSWLNLPYFDVANGHRHGIIEGVPIGLEEFLEWAETHPCTVPTIKAERTKDVEDIETMSHAEAPPCIQELLKGTPEGARSNALFAFGTYLRIRDWQGDIAEGMQHFNSLYLSPPMPIQHVRDAARRISLGSYGYKCQDHPLCDHCDKPTCVTREFGVASRRADATTIGFEGLIKVLTNPPTYQLRMGENCKVQLETDELFDFVVVRKRIFDTTGVLVPKLKSAAWEKMLSEMNTERVEVSAPNDAKPEAATESAVEEFCRTAERPGSDGLPRIGTPKDLLTGRPVAMRDPDTGELCVFFRSQDLEANLRRKRIMSHRGRELWMVLAAMGCNYDEFDLGGSTVVAWSKPFTPISVSIEPAKIEEMY